MSTSFVNQRILYALCPSTVRFALSKIIFQTAYIWCISLKLYFNKSLYNIHFFHHFDFRNGFYGSKLVNRQHLGVTVGAEVADHCHWNALTSLIFTEWGLLSSLDNGYNSMNTHQPNSGHTQTVLITHQESPSNRKISMIFPLVSCCSCVNNPSSS